MPLLTTAQKRRRRQERLGLRRPRHAVVWPLSQETRAGLVAAWLEADAARGAATADEVRARLLGHIEAQLAAVLRYGHPGAYSGRYEGSARPCYWVGFRPELSAVEYVAVARGLGLVLRETGFRFMVKAAKGESRPTLRVSLPPGLEAACRAMRQAYMAARARR